MKNSAAAKLRQVPVGYLMVGVDPRKRKRAAVAITQDFVTHSKFKFTNSRMGFEDALERAKAEMVRNGCRGVMFAISCDQPVCLIAETRGEGPQSQEKRFS